MKKFLAFALFFCLAACGSKLDGKYSSSEGMSMTFKSNGTVIQEMMGVKSEMKYELEGKDIRIGEKGTPAALILTLREDGSINVFGQTLKKQN